MPFNPERCIALVLASGLSTRMGSPKMLLPWNNTTLLGHTLQTIDEAGLSCVLVAPAYAHPVGFSGLHVVNDHGALGLAYSLKMGIAAAQYTYPNTAVAIFLGDQPYLRRSDIHHVLHAFEKRPQGIDAVRPLYNGALGHPVVVSAGTASRAYQLDGDVGLKALFQGHEVQGIERPVTGRPNPAQDLDTWDQYLAAVRSWE